MVLFDGSEAFCYIRETCQEALGSETPTDLLQMKLNSMHPFPDAQFHIDGI